MTLPALPADALSLPLAAKEQGELAEADYALTERARLRHPGARWWWGERTQGGTNGALCYLCDQMIATWQRSYPTPAVAMRRVLLHRDRHARAAITSPGITTGPSLGPAEASPTGGSE